MEKRKEKKIERRPRYRVSRDKELKLLYNRTSCGFPVKINFTEKEKSLLDNMMAKEGRAVRSDFIKEKLFGADSERKFRRMIEKADLKDLSRIIGNALLDFNGKVTYINLRFQKEMREFRKAVTESDISARTAAKWITILLDYAEGIEERTQSICRRYFDILPALGIGIEEEVRAIPPDEREGYLRSIPDEVLDDYARNNPQDTTSDVMMELARRISERKRNGRR